MFQLLKINTALSIFRSYSSKGVPKVLRRVPPKRGEFQTHTALLLKAGIGLEALASKFRDWDHLFQATKKELDEMGLSVKQRKSIQKLTFRYIMGLNLKLKTGKKKIEVKK